MMPWGFHHQKGRDMVGIMTFISGKEETGMNGLSYRVGRIRGRYRLYLVLCCRKIMGEDGEVKIPLRGKRQKCACSDLT